MLKFPCLILDHDDTVVKSEITVNYPYFCDFLNQYRPGKTISQIDYTKGCYDPGFVEMCRQKFGFTNAELKEEYQGWMTYVRTHIPQPYPGMDRIIKQQKELGGKVFVVSHSAAENIRRDYLAHFGVLPDAIFGWDLPAEHRKPNPYALTQIMNTYGFTPNEMLVVDDLKPAWEMVSSLGVQIAFAGWSKKDVPEICEEMSQLCNYSFYSVTELDRFLFS